MEVGCQELFLKKTSNKVSSQNRDRFGGSLRIRRFRFILANWNKSGRRTRAWGLTENKMSAWWGGAGVVSYLSPLSECPAMWVSCSCSLRRIGCQSAGSLVAMQVQDRVKQLIIYCFCFFKNVDIQTTVSKWSYQVWCGKSGHVYRTMDDELHSLLIFWVISRSSVNQILMRY